MGSAYEFNIRRYLGGGFSGDGGGGGGGGARRGGGEPARPDDAAGSRGSGGSEGSPFDPPSPRYFYAPPQPQQEHQQHQPHAAAPYQQHPQRAPHPPRQQSPPPLPLPPRAGGAALRRRATQPHEDFSSGGGAGGAGAAAAGAPGSFDGRDPAYEALRESGGFGQEELAYIRAEAEFIKARQGGGHAGPLHRREAYLSAGGISANDALISGASAKQVLAQLRTGGSSSTRAGGCRHTEFGSCLDCAGGMDIIVRVRDGGLGARGERKAAGAAACTPREGFDCGWRIRLSCWRRGCGRGPRATSVL
jgi:hypothetical protein